MKIGISNVITTFNPHKIMYLRFIIFKYIINLSVILMDKYNLKELDEKLNYCKNMKLEDVTLDDVDEISSIKIDRRKSSNERILDFIMKVKNPYIFKVNGKLVKIRFSDTDKTAGDCLTSVLMNLYR